MRRWMWLPFVLVCSVAHAERLPIRTYSTADGLPRDVVNCVVSDPRGFLWFCTNEGLARFDGDDFVTYGTAQGLPDADVNAFLITRAGEYWVATRKGLALFRPDAASRGQPRFQAHVPGPSDAEQRIITLAEDAHGNLWCSTFDQVYRVVRHGAAVHFEPEKIRIPRAAPSVVTFLPDRDGGLWVATVSGVYRRRADGTLDRPEGLPSQTVTALFQDHAGRVWVGTDAGLCVWPVVAAEGPLPRPTVYTVRDGLASAQVRAIAETATGEILVAGHHGFSRIVLDDPPTFPAGTRAVPVTSASGMPYPGATSFAEDQARNLWVGTDGAGVARIARSGFATFGEHDGLPTPHIVAIFEDAAGGLCVMHAGQSGVVSCLEGRAFAGIRPRFPPGTLFTWGWNQVVTHDPADGWWFTSAEGAWRFPFTSRARDLARVAPLRRIALPDGLPTNQVFRVFRDRRGDVWIATLGPTADGTPTTLARWDRESGRVVTYAGTYGTATAFREDPAGNLWIGLFVGGVTRYRDGTFTTFGPKDGVPEGTITDLLVDQQGRLWIASSRGGLARIDHPGDEPLVVRRFTTADGLSSNAVRCLAEDRWGRVYAGTGRGVDRLDRDWPSPTSRRRHFTTSDGLAAGEPTVALRDSRGDIWFGTVLGLSRHVPVNEPPAAVPRVLLTGLRVAGEERVLSDVGEHQVALGDLVPSSSRLDLTIAAPGAPAGEPLAYQWMVEGVDAKWSAPSLQRTVTLAGLAPGDYRFLARAAGDDRAGAPVVVSFVVLAPVWQRWWFRLGVLAALALAGYSLHRARVGRLLGLERVRTQIATDLHDDIGSGLTRVSILSELVLRQLGGTVPGAVTSVTRIAELSRELADSMGDIVWSVDPAKDHLSDVSQRMRRYASEVFDATDIAHEFHGPTADADIPMGPDVRRQVFLVFKESVNNAVKHSTCRHVSVALSRAGGELALQVTDDGRGFDPERVKTGNGLPGLRRRATKVGGRLDILSAPTRGTTIRMVVPLPDAGPRLRWRRRGRAGATEGEARTRGAS